MLPMMLNDVYKELGDDTQYVHDESAEGDSKLHRAIIAGDFDLVKALTKSGQADVNDRAMGRFYLPEDIRNGLADEKTTNYEGFAYYGEYPLAFAACFGQQQIYDYLIDNGADPNFQDSLGNTVLHMLVINNRKDMYEMTMKHHVKKGDQKILNYARLSPLTLASKLGNYDFFKHIIELEKVEVWRFSNIQCSTYPLLAIDTIAPDGSTDWNSALMILLDGETDEHLDMLEGGVLRQLLDEKWKTFAQARFFRKMFASIVVLLLEMVVVYTHPKCTKRQKLLVSLSANESNLSTQSVLEVDDTCMFRYDDPSDGVLVIISCIITCGIEIHEMWVQGIRGYLRNQMMAPAHVFYLLGCLLFLAMIPFRFLYNPYVETYLLLLAVPMSWVYLLFFARGIKKTGPFVTMIYKMIIGDLVTFFIIYFIFILGFMLAFFFMFKNSTDLDKDGIPEKFDTLATTFMTLFMMTLGDIKYDEFNKPPLNVLTKTVFVVFMVLMPILLLNMLIAMMGNTYYVVMQRSTKEWRRQWAKIVVTLERGYSRKQCQEFQADYAVRLSGKDQFDEEGNPLQHCGLMVIRQLNKSKARQRKGALANWKRAGRAVLDIVKDRMTKGLKSENFDWSKRDKGGRKPPPSAGAQQATVMSAPGSAGMDPATLSTSGRNLASALEQIAWEKNIDFNIAPPVSPSSTRKEADLTPSTVQIHRENSFTQTDEGETTVAGEDNVSAKAIESSFDRANEFDEQGTKTKAKLTESRESLTNLVTFQQAPAARNVTFRKGKRTAAVAPVQHFKEDAISAGIAEIHREIRRDVNAVLSTGRTIPAEKASPYAKNGSATDRKAAPKKKQSALTKQGSLDSARGSSAELVPMEGETGDEQPGKNKKKPFLRMSSKTSLVSRGEASDDTGQTEC